MTPEEQKEAAKGIYGLISEVVDHTDDDKLKEAYGRPTSKSGPLYRLMVWLLDRLPAKYWPDLPAEETELE